jgi:hypothetical protein
MMVAASTSETLVNFYQATRRNISEDSHLHDDFLQSSLRVIIQSDLSLLNKPIRNHVTNQVQMITETALPPAFCVSLCAAHFHGYRLSLTNGLLPR